MVEPQYKFRLHIKNSVFGLKGYFLIQIWEKKKDMVEHTKHVGHAVTVVPFKTSGKASKLYTLNFWSKRLGIEYVMHEIVHALLEWARQNRLDVQYYNDRFYKDEEIFCQACGELSRQFYRRLHALGITEQYDFLESKDYR